MKYTYVVDKSEYFAHIPPQMYDESMDAINKHLVQESTASHLIYTAELRPEHSPQGEL